MKGFTSLVFYAYITEDSMASDDLASAASHVRIVLHILSAASPSNSELIDARRSRTQHLIVDIHGSSFLDNHDMAVVLRKLTTLLRIPTLKRLLIRPRIICPQSALVKFPKDWTLQTREDRVWLATVIVADNPHRQDEWPSLPGGFGMWMKE